MTFWVILGVIILVFAALLFLPISVLIKFKDDFRIKIKFAGFKVFEINPEKEKRENTPEKDTERKVKKKKTEKKNKENIFSKLKGKYGFIGAVKEIMTLAKNCITHIKWLFRHIKFEKIRLNLEIGTPDAAKTAVDYGKACAAVYPVLALLDGQKNVKFKKINVKSDFSREDSTFDFSLKVSSRLFFMILAAFKILIEYNKFKVRNEDNERK